MSGAHRPTWTASVGGDGQRDGANSAPTFQYSSRDLPSHKKLKYRMDNKVKRNDNVQETVDIIKTITDKEEELKQIENKESTLHADDLEESKSSKTLDIDADTDIEDTCSISEDVKEKLERNPTNKDDFSNDHNDIDDTEELLRELERIKKEREAKKLLEARERQLQVQTGNPLLNLSSTDDLFSSSSQHYPNQKRKWNEETVFKNQAKDVNLNGQEKRFINDTIRNDFHKKFMARYIR